MDNDTALPPWIIFLLIALGIAFTVGMALLLAQLDTLQQRALLPQPTLPVVDVDATLAAGDLTVVVISGGDSAGSTPTLAPPTLSAPDEATTAATSDPTPVPPCTAPADGWIPYAVQEGDTWAALAARYGISVEALSQGSCLDESQEPQPGQIIYVPLLTPTLPAEIACGVPPDWVHRTVQPGETLESIARKRNITVGMLLQANCLEDALVVPARKIFVPPLPIKPQSAMPGPPPQKPPPGWHPGIMPTATSPVWPTNTVMSTATRATPTLAPTHTAEPTPSSTVTAATTASQTEAAPPTVTPASPQGTATGEPSYPGAVPSPPAYPQP